MAAKLYYVFGVAAGTAPPELSLAQKYLIWLQALALFAAIVLIVEEYHWWLLLIRRPTTFLDAIIPYSLGATELYVVAFVDNTNGEWFAAMTVQGCLGLLALYTSREDCTSDMFEECLWLLPQARRNLLIGMILVFCMTIDMAGIRFARDYLPIYAPWIGLGVYFALVAAMITISERFLRRIAQEFERIEEQELVARFSVY
jgi:hypothetical protein